MPKDRLFHTSFYQTKPLHHTRKTLEHNRVPRYIRGAIKTFAHEAKLWSVAASEARRRFGWCSSPEIRKQSGGKRCRASLAAALHSWRAVSIATQPLDKTSSRGISLISISSLSWPAFLPANAGKPNSSGAARDLLRAPEDGAQGRG